MIKRLMLIMLSLILLFALPIRAADQGIDADYMKKLLAQFANRPDNTAPFHIHLNYSFRDVDKPKLIEHLHYLVDKTKGDYSEPSALLRLNCFYFLMVLDHSNREYFSRIADDDLNALFPIIRELDQGSPRERYQRRILSNLCSFYFEMLIHTGDVSNFGTVYKYAELPRPHPVFPKILRRLDDGTHFDIVTKAYQALPAYRQYEYDDYLSKVKVIKSESKRKFIALINDIYKRERSALSEIDVVNLDPETTLKTILSKKKIKNSDCSRFFGPVPYVFYDVLQKLKKQGLELNPTAVKYIETFGKNSWDHQTLYNIEEVTLEEALEDIKSDRRDRYDSFVKVVFGNKE